MTNKHDICCRKCGDGVKLQKRKSENEITSLIGAGHFFSSYTTTSLFMMALLVIVDNVLGDDTQALRDTLSSLCSLNSLGKFGSCCVSYDISSVTLASSEARDCFISAVSSTSGSINSLFVFQGVF